MSKLTGEKPIVIQGRTYVLRFTWRALLEIEEAYGGEPNLFNPEVLAVVAAAGLRDAHPEMTSERIMELSPPLIPFASAIQEALSRAYFGTDKIPGTEKKNPLTTGLKRLIGRRPAPELTPSNSGD